MPYYTYEVRDNTGKLIKGQTFAANKEDFIKALQKQGAMILSVTESAKIEEKYARKVHKGVKLKDMSLFAKELSTLIENGIPLVESLDVVMKQIESTDLIKAVEKIKKDVESGKSFRDALAAHPKIFGDMWADLVEAGELSGQLPFVMRQIVTFIEAREDLRKKLINAFLYPAMLLVLAFFTIFVFVFKVVPIFQELFSSFGSKLPPLTAFIISMSYFLRKFFIVVIIVCTGLFFIIARLLATPAGKRTLEKTMFSIPFIGAFMISVSIEKFASTLSVLLKSGIPILKALDVALKTAGSVLFAEKLAEAKIKIISGLPLSESLYQTGLFPPLPIQLILVGEKTGNFSGMLEEVSKYYNNMIDTAVTRFTTLLGPLVLVFMTMVIGTIVIAMFMPVFKLATLG